MTWKQTTCINTWPHVAPCPLPLLQHRATEAALGSLKRSHESQISVLCTMKVVPSQPMAKRYPHRDVAGSHSRFVWCNNSTSWWLSDVLLFGEPHCLYGWLTEYYKKATHTHTHTHTLTHTHTHTMETYKARLLPSTYGANHSCSCGFRIPGLQQACRNATHKHAIWCPPRKLAHHNGTNSASYPKKGPLSQLRCPVARGQKGILFVGCCLTLKGTIPKKKEKRAPLDNWASWCKSHCQVVLPSAPGEKARASDCDKTRALGVYIAVFPAQTNTGIPPNKPLPCNLQSQKGPTQKPDPGVILAKTCTSVSLLAKEPATQDDAGKLLEPN